MLTARSTASRCRGKGGRGSGLPPRLDLVERLEPGGATGQVEGEFHAPHPLPRSSGPAVWPSNRPQHLVPTPRRISATWRHFRRPLRRPRRARTVPKNLSEPYHSTRPLRRGDGKDSIGTITIPRPGNRPPVGRPPHGRILSSAQPLPLEIENRDRGRQSGALRTSRASRAAPDSGKPRKLQGTPALVSSLSRLAGLLGGGRRPERTGLAACRHLFIAITPHSAAPYASQGRSVDQAPPRSGPAPPTVPPPASPWRSASWREGALERTGHPIGPAIFVRRAPTQGRTNPRSRLMPTPVPAAA